LDVEDCSYRPRRGSEAEGHAVVEFIAAALALGDDVVSLDLGAAELRAQAAAAPACHECCCSGLNGETHRASYPAPAGSTLFAFSIDCPLDGPPAFLAGRGHAQTAAKESEPCEGLMVMAARRTAPVVDDQILSPS
jgi:hypothetical protein